ncbi:MAG: MIP family channel protein [Victivallales bacterium]|jgi:glycerol uptake facilitator protein|nr:MIP family channel protein [Victivallales bacterium]
MIRAYVAELIGTFLLVFFGVGVVHAAVLTGAQSGLWHVAVVWAVGVSLAIYASAAHSGAHLNPALTVSFVVFRRFPLRRAVPYVVAQVLGAFLAAAVLYVLFGGVLAHFEATHGLVRGAPGSELAAMVYGEYFPNPGIAKELSWAPSVVSLPTAMLAEAIGTGLLAFFVFALTHPRNAAAPGTKLAPVFIGLTVAAIISILAPLTQAGLNPARDFGPRLFAWFAGWGRIAIPGPRGGFFAVYILAPILGALVGSAVFQFGLVPKLKRTDT